MHGNVTITVDLGYGDAGKGSMVDALARSEPTSLVVRYSGGAQAAHNVVTPDGRHHTFAQFGSGSFVPGVATLLGPQMLVEPKSLLLEGTHLTTLGVNDIFHRLTVHRDAPIITPYHQAANQLRELSRGIHRHGSCGLGIGETRGDFETDPDNALIANDLLYPKRAKEKLLAIRARKAKELEAISDSSADMEDVRQRFRDNHLFTETLTAYQMFADQIRINGLGVLYEALQSDQQVIFEAAQGVLLDEDYGFFPYVTRSKTTTVHAKEMLRTVGYRPEYATTLGITRAYAARHGPGPFPTESSLVRGMITEPHNTHGPWQGAFRMGWFDAAATRYAIEATGGVDGLAVTCLDQASELPHFKAATAYAYQDEVVSAVPSTIPGDLSAMSKRSEWLEAVTARYEKTQSSTGAILEMVTSATLAPIIATSSGILANHKQFFSPTEKKWAA